MILVLTTLVAAAFHLTLGWKWTLLAGVIAGVWGRRSVPALFAGAAGTALAWAAVVLYTAVVAPASLRMLVDTVGALAGNIPGEALVGMTVLLGGVLGALGGGIGVLLRPIVPVLASGGD